MRSGELARARVEEAAHRVAAMAAVVRSRGPVAEVAFDGDAVADRALRVDGVPAALEDAPITVIDLRRASSLAVDSAGAHVALTLAQGGPVIRLDATSVGDSDVDAAIIAAGESQSVVLVARIDAGAPRRVVRDRLRSALPETVAVNVGLAVDDAGPTVTASAASLLAARAARRALRNPPVVTIPEEDPS